MGQGGFRGYADRPNLAVGTRRENPYSAIVASFGIFATLRQQVATQLSFLTEQLICIT